MEKELDIDIAVMILEEFQEWRIGEVDEFTQTPQMLTKAINSILIYFKSEQNELHRLKHNNRILDKEKTRR